MSELVDYDILQLHRLLLLRDPAEGDYESRRTRSLYDLLNEFVGSEEFRLNLQAAVHAGRLPIAPAWFLPVAASAGWAAVALPLDDAHRPAVAAAGGWVALLALIFADEGFRREIEGANPLAGTAGFAAALNAYAHALNGKALIGALEAASPEQVLGWAADREVLDAPVELQLLANGEQISQTSTRLFRRDLQDRLGGAGRYGFAFLFGEDAAPRLPPAAKLEVREADTGIVIGGAKLNPAPEPGPIGRFQDDLREAERALAWLQRRGDELGAATTFDLSEYTAWARAYGGDTPRAERRRAETARGLEGRASISILISRAIAPLDHLPLLEALAAQEAPGWEAVFGCADAEVDALGSLVAQLPSPVRERCRVLPVADHAGALAQARGDHLLLLEGGDTLAPDALHLCLRTLGGDPRPKLLFGDDDDFEPASDGGVLRSSPRLRTRFDPDLLLQEDALGPVICVGRGALEAALADGGSLDLSRRRDLALRVLEVVGPEGIAWIGGVWAHLRRGGKAARQAEAPSEASVLEAETQAHLQRCGSPAQVRVARSHPGHAGRPVLRILHPLPAATAAVIVPTRDRLDLLKPCLDGVERRRADNTTRFEVVVVDNGSEDAGMLRYLADQQARGALRVLRSDAPFNFAALNNLAAASTEADLLIFLNNDIEVLTPDWLDALARHAFRPEVGAVGARLVYEDLTIQHAGVVTGGVHELTAHEGVGVDLADGGYRQRHARTRRVSAVTGACLATRRDVWDLVGGLDAARFAIDGNDVDYCLRVQAADLAVLYTPDCTLFHHESKSRGFNAKSAASRRRGEDEVARLRERWGSRLAHDPFYNPIFDRSARPFQRLGPPPAM